ncbi:MAG: aminoglycoside phosphotransferase family protein [Verrucomicrobia bacterium]|nr:aminoglycoside phosphotransferase family protein [Verrucomicrobiota bacterium]
MAQHLIDRARTASDRFAFEGDVVDLSPYGSGHINDTFVVRCNSGQDMRDYILQRINTSVFKEPAKLMDNVSRVTRHIEKTLREAGETDIARKCPALVDAVDGGCYLQLGGDYWRAMEFIAGGRTYETAGTEEQAFQAAASVAKFQNMLTDLPGPRLHETIPDFHHTPKRVSALKEAADTDSLDRARECAHEICFALDREAMASRILSLMIEGKVPERVTHNDTKLNNVIFDQVTDKALCLIDLDTVMPGSSLYDFGDMARTIGTSTAEDETDLDLVELDTNLFKALVEGYISEARPFLTKTEIDLLPFAGRLMTFETGVRFLTDHLMGDIYFKTHRPAHNLDRCRTQFRLVASMESAACRMDECVRRALR